MEIEVKLKYSDRDTLVSKLKETGYSFNRTKEIQDSYFGQNNSKVSNSHSLYRIRNIVGVKSELTFKDGFSNNNGVWTKRELNILIDKPEEMTVVLRSLGCELIKENYSKREIWTKNDIEVAIIDFSKPAELHIAEIEGPSNDIVSEEIKTLGSIVEIAGEDIFAVFDK